MMHRFRFRRRFFSTATLAVAAGWAGQAVGQTTGPSSSQSPYLLPTFPGVQTISIMTVGDSVNMKPDGVTPYRMVGIADGLGGFTPGNDGSFTLLMNHELPVNVTTGLGAGIARAHGQAGAFVSQWTIDAATLQVRKVEDFLPNATSLYLSNNVPGASVHSGFLAAGTSLIGRLCSADLAPVSAYRWTDASSGTTYGTPALLFQSGEEQGGVIVDPTGAEAQIHYGRQFAFVATDDPNIAGDQSRTGYELPHAGLFSWENNLASPLAQRKTVVMGMDDGAIGQIYVWVGDKQTTGNVVERAGLTRQSAADNLYVLKATLGLGVDGAGDPMEQRSVPVSGRFSLENEGDVSGVTFGGLESLSDSHDATQFFRPEDGHWDPINANRFYFVTTDRVDEFKDNLDSADVGTNIDQVGRSRLYMLEFDDITNPTSGGTITALLDGTEPSYQMLDNMTAVAGVDGKTRLLLQEDPGNWGGSAAVWLYDVDTDALTKVLHHDPSRFGMNNSGVVTPHTAPFTADEESSGVIDARDLLDLPGVGGVPGLGWFLMDVQAHYNPGGPELVEGGQLLAAYIPQAVHGVPEPSSIALLALGMVLLRRRR